MLRSSGMVVWIQPQHQAEAAAQRRADQALARGGADGGEALDVHRHGARAGAGADEDIHAEIFQRGVDHFLHVGLQAMNFIDEENFAFLNIAEDADQVEFLLQHRTGGLLPADSQLRRDDARERGFAQAGRAVEEHVIHRLAALFRGFDGDGEILLDLGLAGEIVQEARAKGGFKLPFIFAQRRGNDAVVVHEAPSLPSKTACGVSGSVPAITSPCKSAGNPQPDGWRLVRGR